MWPYAAQIAVGVLSLVGVGLGGHAAYKSNTKAKRIESEAAPYQQLAGRVDALEQKVTVLLSDQWVDRTYMRQMLQAWPSSVPLPEPMPTWLALHYGITPTHMPTPGSIIEPPRRKH